MGRTKEPAILGPSCIVVRAIADRQLVGIFFGYDEGEIIGMIDECIDPYRVEFRELMSFGLIWPNEAIAIPSDDIWPNATEDEGGESILREAMLGFAGEAALTEDGDWFRFTDGHVYLLKSGDRYKIGYAVNVENRLSQLRTGSPYPIELIHAFPADREEERRLHKWYAEYRRHGEWFELPDKIVGEIKAR